VIAATLGGWALAVLAAGAALAARHGLHTRMEAVARACHELRGPLTAVRLGLSLPTGAGGLSSARLEAIDVELARATLALDDLARARQPAAGGTPGALERVSLSRLLTAMVAAAQGTAAVTHATVTGSWEGVDGVVWGDRPRLAQALGNLIANAVEHGGGAVRVRGELRGARAQITVDDGGSGLPAPVAELARRPQAGRGARGRGLAIALGIARSHGGTIAAAPVGRGGRVVLVLPACGATHTSVPPKSPKPLGLDAHTQPASVDVRAQAGDPSAPPHRGCEESRVLW
jgi:signal transduction histidine kinase